ncbi:ESX secretion-associated protein EspG [Goodfellowiella coeruleoviolacea]|uniref:EspG family protein n=1 Tax=Goodfellowiella coeruleoviolacea TaxID=334858 RepID=A0AAE3GJG4_9PSEU|nr:ESX secretion-associated protein EspG [Goodfellowiella coeruleoviolacea]MCP2169315.1 EspG family protein [Goodfellowiella coeruleoviolacea]
MTAAIGEWTPVELSTEEFEVCWRVLELGELPHALDLPSPGRTWAERETLVKSTLDSLAARGLADRRGVHPDLAGQLAGLARFSWAVDARLHTERRLRAWGAVSGASAVLAVIDDEEHSVVTRTLPEPALCTELVGLLPPAEAPRWDSVSLESSTLDEAVAEAAQERTGDVGVLADVLTRRGVRPAQARAVARMVDGAGWRGQFGVTVSGSTGTWRRARRVVGFHDVPAGRIMHLRRGGWVTLTPASARQLVAAIGELVAETRD